MGHTAELLFAETLPAYPVPADGLAIDVVEDWARLQPVWDDLIADGGASAYQSYALQSALKNHASEISNGKSIAAVLRDSAGRIVMILPLVIKQSGPIRIARFAGGKHVNFNLPITANGAVPMSRDALYALVQKLGRAIGCDLFDLINMPLAWEGRINPFATLPGTPSPSFGYKTALTGDCETLIINRLSDDARSKLKRKAKKLAEIAPISFREAATPEEASRFLEAFLAHKAARLAAMGIDDPFSEPGVEAFIREASTTGFDKGKPAIRLYAMLVGERIVATYGATVDERRFSGMFTAFDATPDVGRFSPGEHLLMWLVQSHCRMGLATFDLGVGEARYKQAYCEVAEPLVDVAFPVTRRGALFARFSRSKSALKRRLKQDTRFMKLLGVYRQWKASRR
jgi:CelD/BcsL family acetyltransferase involved in cellulose biosynthesis